MKLKLISDYRQERLCGRCQSAPIVGHGTKKYCDPCRAEVGRESTRKYQKANPRSGARLSENGSHVCSVCNKKFFPIRKDNANKFCSRKCMGAGHSSETHPDLKRDFFKVIDAKEKAYWLGFCYADAGMTDRSSVAVAISLAIKDEERIDEFIKAVGANPSKKSYSEKRGQVRISIGDQEFCRHLIDNGCGFRKSASIRFPTLEGRDLQLAFLLGYFDGDGTIVGGNPVITSGSFSFLHDISEIIEPREAYSGEKLRIRSLNGGRYHRLCLGRNLYREMIKNYHKSMPRKRLGK